MALYVLTSSSPGAPTLSGTNGSACTVLDWALNTIAGVAIEYTAANARVYRWPFGNRFRLNVRHDSAVSGHAGRVLVRMSENASDATTLIDPSPLPTQVADASSNWLVSTTADGTARAYEIVIDDGATSGYGWIHVVVNASGATDQWSWGFFGDVLPRFSADTWNTVIQVRDQANQTFNSMTNVGSTTMATGNTHTYWIRSIDGTVKSSRGGIESPGGTNLGVQGAQFPAPFTGYGGGLMRSRCPLFDGYSQTTTNGTGALFTRGWMPNIWNPLHNNGTGASSLDDFTDSDYAVGSLFRIFKQSGGANPFLFIEETPTYYPPSN